MGNFIGWFATSAKTGQNLKQGINYVIAKVMENKRKLDPMTPEELDARYQEQDRPSPAELYPDPVTPDEDDDDSDGEESQPPVDTGDGDTGGAGTEDDDSSSCCIWTAVIS